MEADNGTRQVYTEAQRQRRRGSERLKRTQQINTRQRKAHAENKASINKNRRDVSMVAFHLILAIL